ncbi:uncharacterized protein LOC129600882 [Paramacrobiotus metropolitanus]|uniref:uncharacterized protein LOC129600882 n=1 Tax=Paramacrobiotus metropolitanus TaxID=2943436 RepID=UPI002445B757|nr:uncharacterized protein LOC129600882 [Paramacrobiotus metropolitanus]
MTKTMSTQPPASIMTNRDGVDDRNVDHSVVQSSLPFPVAIKDSDKPTTAGSNAILRHLIQKYGCVVFDVLSGKTRELFGAKVTGKENTDQFNADPVPTTCAAHRQFPYRKSGLKKAVWIRIGLMIYAGLILVQLVLGAWTLAMVDKHCRPDENGFITVGNVTIVMPLNGAPAAPWVGNVSMDAAVYYWEYPVESDPPDILLVKLCFGVSCTENCTRSQVTVTGRVSHAKVYAIVGVVFGILQLVGLVTMSCLMLCNSRDCMLVCLFGCLFWIVGFCGSAYLFFIIIIYVHPFVRFVS